MIRQQKPPISSRASQVGRGCCLLAVLAALGLGWVLMFDRPGLRVEYFALDPRMTLPPTFSELGPLEELGPDQLAGHLVSQELFAIRWSGWLEIPDSQDYRFEVQSNGQVDLQLAGQSLLQTDDRVGRRRRRARVRLEPGLHPIEVRLSQDGGPARMHLRWSTMDLPWSSIPIEALYASKPGPIRKLLRHLSMRLPSPGGRALGAVVLAAAVPIVLSFAFALGRRSGLSAPRLRKSFRRLARNRPIQLLLILILTLAVWRVVYPYTGSTADGDDVRYLDAAVFAKKMGWIVNRYVHVHLLRAFMLLRDGDAFLGSRTYWSFLFAVTVGSLAFAARALGPKLQVRTFAIALFLLASQAAVMSGVGTAYADYSAMMFITLAVAVYMTARFPTEVPDPRWYGLAIGALTLAAMKSKETGLVLLWIPLMFLWGTNGIDRRRFVRFLLFWMFGGALAYLILLALDARILGDTWFSLRPETLFGLGRLHDASEGKSKWDALVWLEVVWAGIPRFAPTNFALRHLGVLVVLSAATAFGQRKSMDVRLLHLMPVAYIAMMIAIHPAFLSSRFLIPIIPVACLVGAMLFNYLGLEQISWRSLGSAKFQTPMILMAASVPILVVPLRQGTFASDGAIGSGIDLESLLSILALGAVLSLICVLIWGRRAVKLIVSLVCLIGFFGPGVATTLTSLERKIAVQRGELILYPWSAFKGEIEAERPRAITLSPRIVRQYGMTGQRITRNRLARIYFRRAHLRVASSDSISLNLECVIGDNLDYIAWAREIPELEGAGLEDRTEALRLLFPRRIASLGN